MASWSETLLTPKTQSATASDFDGTVPVQILVRKEDTMQLQSKQRPVYTLEHTLTQQPGMLEEEPYTSYGVIAKLIDPEGEVVMSVEDVTESREVAEHLFAMISRHKVPPWCLPLVIEQYLNEGQTR